MKSNLLLICLLLLFGKVFSQSVGIGTTTPSSSAQLDVTSTTKGLLLPRMTLAQRNAIATPATGLLIYQTDNTPGFYYYNGASWIQFSTGSATNYWTANGTHIFSNNTGNVGIGVNPPAYKLDIDGRIRIRTGTIGNVSTSSGMWLEDFRTGTNRIFFGMQDSIHAGFYGGGAGDVGWDFNFNATNGNVGIGVDNPSDKLAINGGAYITGALPVLKIGGDGSAASARVVFQLPASNKQYAITQVLHSLFLSRVTGVFGFVSDLVIDSTGQIGIGTNLPAAKLHVLNNVMIGSGSPAAGYLLSVNGKMIAEEVRVELDATWPDYVFDKGYKLLPLNQLEQFIQDKKHLPNIPAARQIQNEGINLGDMNRRLLEKIEELTLYIIEQDKKINVLQKQMDEIRPVH